MAHYLVRELLQLGTERLSDTSPSATLDAELLLCHLLEKNRTWLLIHDDHKVEERVYDHYLTLIARRETEEPIAYILNRQEFYGRSFIVTPEVLIPRPDTELIVEKVLQWARQREAIRMIDLGTGSGCLAVTLALELGERATQILAVDISDEALAVARTNASSLGVGSRIQLSRSSWWESVDGPFDLVVANPPYISPADQRVSSITLFEPPRALFSSEDGLNDFRTIVAGLERHLAVQGGAFLEIGDTQADRALSIAAEHGFAGRTHIDYAGKQRVVELWRELDRVVL